MRTLSSETAEREIVEVVSDLLDEAANRVGWAGRAGEDYDVIVTDATSYRARASTRYGTPEWVRFRRRIFDGSDERWMVTVLHELAHLMTFDGHGANWQEKYRELLNAYGYTVEFGRTPGYETLVENSEGETIVKRYRRRTRQPEMDGFNVESVEAGNYVIEAPDGTLYRVCRTYASKRDTWCAFIEDDVESLMKERRPDSHPTTWWVRTATESVGATLMRYRLADIKREIKRMHGEG